MRLRLVWWRSIICGGSAWHLCFACPRLVHAGRRFRRRARHLTHHGPTPRELSIPRNPETFQVYEALFPKSSLGTVRHSGADWAMSVALTPVDEQSCTSDRLTISRKWTAFKQERPQGLTERDSLTRRSRACTLQSAASRSADHNGLGTVIGEPVFDLLEACRMSPGAHPCQWAVLASTVGRARSRGYRSTSEHTLVPRSERAWPPVQLPRSAAHRAGSVITQNFLNGVVRCHVVRAPAGSEAMSPAVSFSTCPSSISILAEPSRTRSVSLPGRVHLTGSVASVKRDIPDSAPWPAHRICISPPTSGSGSHASADTLDTNTPGYGSIRAE
jgi:hypothetical protein